MEVCQLKGQDHVVGFPSGTALHVALGTMGMRGYCWIPTLFSINILSMLYDKELSQNCTTEQGLAQITIVLMIRPGGVRFVASPFYLDR